MGAEVLNGDWRATLSRWYPDIAVNAPAEGRLAPIFSLSCPAVPPYRLFSDDADFARAPGVDDGKGLVGVLEGQLVGNHLVQVQAPARRPQTEVLHMGDGGYPGGSDRELLEEHQFVHIDFRDHHLWATGAFDRSVLLPTGRESEGGFGVGRWPRILDL